MSLAGQTLSIRSADRFRYVARGCGSDLED